MTVGEVLDALATVRRDTPFLVALNSGALAGPAALPRCARGVTLADVPEHYHVQPRGLDGGVAVVVVGLAE